MQNNNAVGLNPVTSVHEQMDLSEDVLKCQTFQSLELQDFCEGRTFRTNNNSILRCPPPNLLYVMNPFIELIGYSIQSKLKCFWLDLGKTDECGFRRGLLVDTRIV